MSERKHNIDWMELPREEQMVAVKNPFCGLYTIYRFCVWDEHEQGVDGSVIEDCCVDENQTLALVEINLNKYREEALSTQALMYVQRVFRFFKHKHKQMILRFLYDWNGTNIQTEPKNLDTILEHMEQLGPLMKAYDDTIYIVQGLFIGNWGEMHTSRHLSSNALIRLSTKLRACVGDNASMAVRSPAFWRLVNRTYEPIMSWNDKNRIRFGLYNDGMLASDTDLGTYGELHRAEMKKPEDKMLRDYEIAFQKQLCTFVPNGGEVVQPCALNDFEHAAADLKDTHVSYLNSVHDVRVWDKWKNITVKSGSEGWKNRTAYDYIVAHLGYRFLLEDVEVSLSERSDDTLKLDFTVSNNGFSGCYRKLDVELMLYDVERDYIVKVQALTNTLIWQPDCTVKFTVEADISSWNDETVNVAIRLSDPVSGEKVRFCNVAGSENAEGFDLIGSVEV